MAEAGVHDTMAQFAASIENAKLKPATNIGTKLAPLSMGTGDYWVDIVETAETVTLTATGRAGNEARAVEVVLTLPSGGIYANGIFSGNSSGDPTYTLDLGGLGSQADVTVRSHRVIFFLIANHCIGRQRNGGNLGGRAVGLPQRAPDLGAAVGG